MQTGRSGDITRWLTATMKSSKTYIILPAHLGMQMSGIRFETTFYDSNLVSKKDGFGFYSDTKPTTWFHIRFQIDNIVFKINFSFSSVFDSATNFKNLSSSKSYVVQEDHDNSKPTFYLSEKLEHHSRSLFKFKFGIRL